MPAIKDKIELTLDTTLKEYESMRREMLLQIQQHQQTLALTLGSVPIIIPLLLGQINNIPPFVLGSFLYVLSVVYAVVSMHMAQLQFNIDSIGYYIHVTIEPRVNKLLSLSKDDDKVMQWETFLRKGRANPFVLIANSIGSIGTIILMNLPSVASLLMANYLVSTNPQSSSTPWGTVVAFFSYFSWVIYSLSVLGWIIILYLEIFHFKLIQGKPKPVKQK